MCLSEHVDLSEHVHLSPVTMKTRMAPTTSIKIIIMYYTTSTPHHEKNEPHHVHVVLLSDNVDLSENAELGGVGGGDSAHPKGDGGGGTRGV